MKNEYIPPGYARVTEVLSPFNNFDAIDPKVLANAADRGSRVHDYCELHALNLFVGEIDHDCKGYFESFKRWFDQYVSEVVYTENRMNSSEYRISGKCDLIVKIKGDDNLCIVDLKTPATASRSWQLQTAAYQLLAKECLGIDVGRRMSLMLPKDGCAATVKEYLDHKEDLYMFLNALELFRFFKF